MGFHVGDVVDAVGDHVGDEALDGSGAKMYVPRLRYSFTMSFCVVPASRAVGNALLRRPGPGRAPHSHAAVALIVIDVFISPSGMSSRVGACARGARPVRRPCPPRPRRRDRRGRIPSGLAGRRRSRARLTLGQVASVELVGGARARMSRVGPHDPGLGSLSHPSPIGRTGRNRPGLSSELAGAHHAAKEWHRLVVGVAVLVVERVEDGERSVESRPGRAARRDPSGKPQPPFIAASMPSFVANAISKSRIGVVEIREKAGRSR